MDSWIFSMFMGQKVIKELKTRFETIDCGNPAG